MRSHRRSLVAVVLVASLAATTACSGDDATTGPATGPTTEADGSPAPSEADRSVIGDESETSDPESSEPSPQPAPEPDPEPEPEPAPPRLVGLDHIEQSTPMSGGGDRPLLDWSIVDGADHYGVYLYAPDDAIYWAWQGRDTSVFVGGESQLPDSIPGPSVVDDMSWSVVAFDADLVPIAVSEQRPIAP